LRKAFGLVVTERAIREHNYRPPASIEGNHEEKELKFENLAGATID